MKKYLTGMMILLALGSLCGCRESAQAPELLEPVGVKVDTATAGYDDLYEIAAYNGEVVPYVEELYFVTDGKLEEIKVTAGESVQKGQTLAVLDNEQALREIDTMEEELAYTRSMGEYDDRIIETDIAIAEEELAILEEKEASPYDIEKKKLEIEVLQTQLAQAQELRSLDLEYREKQLADLRAANAETVITAPFDGKVVYVSDVRTGDPMTAFEPVIYLADETRLSVLSDYITERNIAKADKIYTKIQDQEYTLTYMPYEEDEYYTMMLAGETVNVQFAIDQPTAALESGQYAVVYVLDSWRENVLTIPANAVYRDGSGEYVYKIADGERVRCEVETGLITDLEAEILEGLQEGDEVYVKD